MLENLKDANEELNEARAQLIAEDDDFELPSFRHEMVHSSLNSSRREISIMINRSAKDEGQEESETDSYIRFQNSTDESSNKTGLRQRRGFRTTCNHSVHSLSKYESDWDLVQREASAMVSIQERKNTLPESRRNPIVACLRRIWSGFEPTVTTPKYYGLQTENDGSKGFVTNLEHPSYAVVTFTSRYSAIIARQCLGTYCILHIRVRI